MYQFIESIRIEDGEIYLLEEHQERIKAAFFHFGKSNYVSIRQVMRSIKIPRQGLFKLRIEYDLDANFTTEILPYERHYIKSFQCITNNDLDYPFKYKNRTVFSEMKAQAMAEEIIIIQRDCITDTSFSNIIFKKNNEWLVPKTYLLNGVQRQWLLKQKKIKEWDITLQNISDFTHFKLINAMNDLQNAITYDIQKIIPHTNI